MKNENLPLIQALKGRSKKGSVESFHSFEPPRTFQLQHHEIPGLPGKKIGETISVNLKGKVHMQHADGHAVMHVTSVKPDSQEMADKTNPDKATTE